MYKLVDIVLGLVILLKMPPATRPLDNQPRRWSLFGLPVADQTFRDIFTSSEEIWLDPASPHRCCQRVLLFLLLLKEDADI